MGCLVGRGSRVRRASIDFHFDERQSMTVVSLPRRDALHAHERVGGRGEIRGAHTDDEEWAPAGDATARFNNLVLPHLGDAYSLARWITGSRADAEDVVQDACLRAFRAIGGFAGGNARPWLLTIVRNTAYTWLRKNRPSAILAVEDLEGVEAAQANPGDPERATPETELIAKADAASLEAGIAALPAAYRETMILRDVQGLSYREIAEVTGVPIGTVMSRLARGRDHVIKAIGRSAA
jgi:RNA polymerase sigma factor (sigma-70 family)